MQHMLRTICKSRTYQSSIVTNKWNAGRRHQLLARHRPPPAGRSAVRHDPASDRLGEPSAGRAGRLSRGAVARRGPDAAQRILRGLRPPGPRKLVRVRALQRHDAGPRDDAGQRPDDCRRDCRRRQRNHEARGRAAGRRESGRRTVRADSRRVRPRRPKSKRASKPCTPAARNWPSCKPSWPPTKPSSTPSKPSGKPRRPVPRGPRSSPPNCKASMSATFAKQPDHSVLVEGANGTRHVHDRAAHRAGRRDGDSPGTVGRCQAARRRTGPRGRTAIWCCRSCGPRRRAKADPAKSMPLDVRSRHGRFQPGGLPGGQRRRRQPEHAAGRSIRRSARTTMAFSRSRTT